MIGLDEEPSMTHAYALKFAQDWIDSWNSRDLKRILAHYTDDFTMSSPMIAQVTGEGSGSLTGKAAVAAYWKEALERFPQLHFELLSVFLGIDSIALYYKSVGGRLAIEVFSFNAEGKVSRAHAFYIRERGA
jgi:hypothetical protein